jgi:HlyD family secretion protein
MTVSVEIEIGRKADAVVVPLGAVRELQSPKPWVLVAEGGVAVRRDVALGLRDAKDVELTSGLAAGEVVLLPESAKLEAGQKVKPALARAAGG